MYSLFNDKRARRIKIVLSAGLFCVSALLLWGIFFEPYHITVRRVTVSDPLLAASWDGLKIAQLSDIHITEPGRRERQVLEVLSNLKPDIIVITGDIAQWNSDPQGAVKFMESLHAPLGVFCVMGDADFSSRRRHCLFCHPKGNVHKLRTHPVLLRDETRLVNIGKGRKMLIAGVAPQGDWAGTHDFPEALLEMDGPPVLILSHFSGRWNEIIDRRPVLWLSGDTHGGQILMPEFFWKYIHKKPDPSHMYGLFRKGEHNWLYVNPGIGTTENVPVRLGVPPEITLFTFKEANFDNEKGV